MNIELDDADRAFVREVRDFIAVNLTDAMRAGQARASGSYPHPSVSIPWQKALASRGWLVPLWPVEWGGSGWSGLRRYLFEIECARAGAPLVHPMGTRFIGPVLIRFGSEAQKCRFLPRIVASDDYWCQGFSEPDAGSDLASLTTRATRTGAGWRLDGRKTWTTHAQHANWIFVLARTRREARRQDGISLFLVDMRSPGIEVRPIATMGGDHDVNDVLFDGVQLPADQLVGEEGQGWTCAKYLLEFERGAGIFAPRLRSQLARVGRAMTAAGEAAQPLVPAFAEVCAELDAFEWGEFRTLAPLRPGENPGPVASLLKLASARLKQAIAELGMQALGPAGWRWRGDEDILVPEYGNSRAYTIFGGSAEVQLSLIARSLLAQAA